MKKHTIATITGTALAALSIGLAAPVIAAPAGPDTNVTTQDGNKSNPGTVASQVGLPQNASTNAYGTYQNENNRGSGARR